MDQYLGLLASESSDSNGEKTKNKKWMPCLGMRTDLSFILNKQIEDPYVSTYTTIVSIDIPHKYLGTYTIGVSMDIPHKYLDHSLVSRLFNYTTVVRIYDLPSHGVWMGFTVPGNYSLIWNSPQFHKAQKTFQKNDKKCKMQKGGKRLVMLSSIQDSHCKYDFIMSVSTWIGPEQDCRLPITDWGRVLGALPLTAEFLKTVNSGRMTAIFSCT